MKRETWRYTGKAVLFLVIGLFLFRFVTVVFLEKNSYGKYRNYKAQEKVDILVLGSSHSDDGIDPQIIEKRFLEEKGEKISVFNYSIYGMRVEQMRFFLKEILKEHTPEVIVLETFAFVPIADEHREILARRAFDVFPLSKNKIEAIRYCTAGERSSYYIPLMKYHTRWKELKERDIRLVYEADQWKKAGKHNASSDERMDEADDYFAADTAHMDEIGTITDTEKESIEEILSVAKDRGILVVFASVPFKEQMGMDSLEMIKINNYLRETYADKEKVWMLDMNRMWQEMKFGYSDLYNEGHCNQNGAKKVTNVLTDFLLSIDQGG